MVAEYCPVLTRMRVHQNPSRARAAVPIPATTALTAAAAATAVVSFQTFRKFNISFQNYYLAVNAFRTLKCLKTNLIWLLDTSYEMPSL